MKTTIQPSHCTIPAFLQVLLGICLTLSLPLQAANIAKIHLQPLQQQAQQVELQWWLEGLQRGATVESTELIIDGKPVSSQVNLEPKRGQSVCYMVMVDTSGSMKPYFKNKTLHALLKSLIDNKPNQHYLGLALFAKNWRELQTPTQDKKALLTKLDKVTKQGQRTELLRFTEDGVAALEACPAPTYRKVLIILTDGDAEDKAYTVESAVHAAKQKNISLYAFGFGDTLKLQLPRRLVEGSGGWLAEPKHHNKKNRKKTIQALYADSNSGGTLQFTLAKNTPEKTAQLKIVLSSKKTLKADIPLSLNTRTLLPAWKKTLLNWLPLTLGQLNALLWGFGILLLMLLVWWLYRLLRTSPEPEQAPRHIEGYLIHQGQSYAIYSGINRIGFLPDNDIVIDDDTVGRAHATVHYRGEGDVILTDLNSLNGSWVNGNRVENPSSIQDGDTIVLGHWRATFQRKQEI